MKRTRKLISIVLTVLMIASVVVAVPVTSSAAGAVKLTHHMTCSMKQGDYPAFEQPYGYNAGCCAVSYAVGLSIIKGYSIEPTQFWYNGTTNYTQGLINDWEDYSASKLYQSICDGKPVMVYYFVPAEKNNGKASEHWVLCLGAKDNSLSTSSFICIDPVYGTERTLNNCWGMGNLYKMRIFTKSA